MSESIWDGGASVWDGGTSRWDYVTDAILSLLRTFTPEAELRLLAVFAENRALTVDSEARTLLED